MLALQAFHLAAYPFAHGTFQPPAATVASDLTLDSDASPDGFSYRAIACPLQWLPVLLAGAPRAHRRRLINNVFTTKGDLMSATWQYNADAASTEAEYGPIAGWNVSRISDMSWLFSWRQNFNADISSWDTSSVTDMSYMFDLASAFNQPLSFDTSSVTAMTYMFDLASAFNQPLSLDTSKVRNMYAMFRNAAAFNQLLSLDTSSVTDMSYMFSYASAFNQPLSFDTCPASSTCPSCSHPRQPSISH